MSHTANWNEKVARGRRLVTEINDRKWELGDLANEVCPAGANGVHNDDILGTFADEIGVAHRTLHTYRYVSTQWPAVARATAQTWTTHKMLAAREDRHEIINEQIWTYNSLSRRLGTKPNPSRITPDPGPNDRASLPPTLQADITEALSSEGSRESLMRSPAMRRAAREALSDPQTAKDIFKDRRVATAAERAMQSNEDEAEARAESEPTTKRFKNAERQARFQTLLSKANLALRDAAVELAAIDPLVAHQIAEAEYELTEINSRAEWLRIHLGDSGKSLDAELADLLAEGAQ